MFIKTFFNNNYLCFFLICVFFQNATAQEYSIDVQKLSVNEGLSNRFAQSICKDSKGFIWIGTKNGLNRYDGYNFKEYTTNESLNSIIDIFEDDQERLWVLKSDSQNSSKNVALFDINKDSLFTFSKVFDKSVPFKSSDVKQIRTNKKKEIWINTLNGNIYRYKNNAFKLVYTIPEKWNVVIDRVNDNFIWLVEEKINIKEDKRIIKLSLKGDFIEEIFLKAKTNLIDIDKNNAIWVYNRDTEDLKQVHDKYKLKSLDLDFLKLPEDMFPIDRYETSRFNPYNDLLWWYHKGKKNHFYLIDLKTGERIDILEKFKLFFSYKSVKITNIHFINENQTWIGTEDGVFIITIKNNTFKTLLADKKTSNSIRGIIEDDNKTLYINSYKERIRISSDRKEITRIPKKSWRAITKDTEGNIWQGSYTGILKKYTPANGKEIEYLFPSKNNKHVHLSLLVDKNKRVWSGSHSGLSFLKPNTDTFIEFTNYGTYPQLANSNIYHLEEHKDGIWIASSTGLYFMNSERKITKYFSSKQPVPYNIPFDNILHFTQDKQGYFWLATSGGGLIKLDITSGKYEQFTTENGMSSNTIYAVYEDDFNRLWLPSEYGLMLFDKKDYSVQTFLKIDGIAHNEFNTTSHYKDSEGKFYFGGLSGITVVNPKEISIDNIADSPLHITNCQVLNGTTGELNNITTKVKNSGKIELFPNDKSLIIGFSMLNYENTKQNSYAYKIEGLEKNWTNTNHNSIRYNNLPYGDYTIVIKAKDAKGKKAINELTILLKVNKPFYLTAWFIITCIGFLVFLIYSIFKFRLKRLQQTKNILELTVKERTKEIENQKNKIEKQSEKLKELDQVKSKFFANISHELRTPITLILGPLHSIIEKLPLYKNNDIPKLSKSLEIMERNGKSLLNTVEEILDLSKLEAHKIELQENSIPFYTFCKQIFYSFESLAVSRNITYNLLFKLHKNILLTIDQSKVEKIITNLLSNAFKYSKDNTKITMHVTEESSSIKIIISDTGLGIHTDDLPYIFDRFYQSKQTNTPVYGGTGIGLALCKELTSLMNGKLTVKSTLNQGSSFTFMLPKKEIATLPNKATIETKAEIEIITKKPNIKTSSNFKNDKKKTILIVEDHEDMRNFIVDILHDQYHIITANHGEKALQILENKNPLPDIIVSDVMMPTMDGFTMLKRIKSKQKWQMIPVILLTARSAENDLLNGLKIGVNDYVTKPFNPPELIARIDNLLINYTERKAWLQKEKIKEEHVSTVAEQEVSWDTEWVKQAKEIVNREIGNATYKITDLAHEMNISESQLLLKMKQVTGLTPKEFIREIKLQHARMLLESKAKRTIAEVAYAAGFNTPGYFSTVYENHFGKRPASYFK